MALSVQSNPEMAPLAIDSSEGRRLVPSETSREVAFP